MAASGDCSGKSSPALRGPSRWRPVSAHKDSLQNAGMHDALAALPDSQLFELGRAAGEAARPGYGWIVAAVEWEKRRRNGSEPGEFPDHGIAASDLSDAIGNLWAFAARIRANPDGVNLWPIVAVLDAAVAQLTIEMERRGNRLR